MFSLGWSLQLLFMGFHKLTLRSHGENEGSLNRERGGFNWLHGLYPILQQATTDTIYKFVSKQKFLIIFHTFKQSQTISRLQWNCDRLTTPRDVTITSHILANWIEIEDGTKFRKSKWNWVLLCILHSTWTFPCSTHCLHDTVFSEWMSARILACHTVHWIL